jgi:branched-chain amino acid transport system ATP-binding protein
MFNALIGLIIPTKGEIIYDGQNITKMSAATRCHKGIGRTYQVPRPFEGMSVFENVLVAAVHGAAIVKKKEEKWRWTPLNLQSFMTKEKCAQEN